METPFKVIKTEAEYLSALKRFETLLEPDEDHRSLDDLELLSVLIEKYEDEHYPIDPPDHIEAHGKGNQSSWESLEGNRR